jgi:hypothetical protein
MQRDILDDAVALVEDAEDRDPLAHRGNAGLVGARGDAGVGDHRTRRIALVLAAPAAGGKGERQQCEGGGGPHFYSGIHGS